MSLSAASVDGKDYGERVEAPFTVLVVCRANVCRSPVAEVVMNRYLGDAGINDVVAVYSAGTDVLPGDPMCKQGVAWLGLSGAPRAAVALTASILAGADLVLAADRQARTACANLDPGCRPRLFTLNQAAVLAAAIAPAPAPASDRTERLRWLTGEMDASRILLSGRDEELDDIVDRHGLEDHAAVFEEVSSSGLAVVSGFDWYIAPGSV